MIRTAGGGCEPCPMCDAYEKRQRGSIRPMTASEIPANRAKKDQKWQEHRDLAALLHHLSISGMAFDEYRPPADDEAGPPCVDWVVAAIYFAIAAIAVVGVGLAYGVIG
jgi:hypothetical protein